VATLQSGNDAYQVHPGITKVTLQTSRFNRSIGKLVALPLQARELAALLREWNPDVRVSFLPRANLAHIMTRWFGNQELVIVTEQVASRNAYSTKGIVDSVMRYLIRKFYPKADAVFPSSKGVLEGLKSFGVPESRMHVVYNAVELESVNRRMRDAIADLPASRLPLVITVGRHVDQKDHETLLHAFAKVRQRMQARLVLIGQGPRRVDLESLSRELNLVDCVVFAGWQDNPFAWMARSDLFVLSSQFEGFGNVIIEAMACSLPVIATDCPSGPAEILRNGKDGILVPVGDVEALANAITTVLTNKALHGDLAEKARRRASDFDISRIGPKYEALLRSFAQERARLSLNASSLANPKCIT
jgi:glycosyltransferase involved in cell wall biosynthesis